MARVCISKTVMVRIWAISSIMEFLDIMNILTRFKMR
jgi:hypothetical protein